MRRVTSLVLVGVLLLSAMPLASLAETFADPAFRALWAATDEPVAAGALIRSWVWGPEPITAGRAEAYAEAPGGQRLVQYFDKGRMELTAPGRGVSSGLLARELLTGRLQTGDDRFEQRAPAALGLVGDPDDPFGPTYATLGLLTGRPALDLNAPVIETVSREGAVGADGALSRYGVRADQFVPETGHRLASVFRAYFEGTPLPDSEGQPIEQAPFAPWYSVTGWPITEAYWTRARVGTIVQDVLVQAFERRVLTYTPANPPGSRVEMGNVGRHYLTWLATSPAPPAVGGLPCPTFPVVPTAEKGRSPFVLLGSAVHEVEGRRYATGAVRNDGVSSGPIQVTVVQFDAAGRVVGRNAGFTDRDFWPNGQVAAFQVDLTGPVLATWRVDLRDVGNDPRPTGGLAGGFRVEGLHGEVDGLGIASVQGVLHYAGPRPFTDIAIIRIQALDACGSVVTNGFAQAGRGALAPGAVVPFSALLSRAEGAVRLRAVVEARTGTAALVADDALRLYDGDLYPAPLVPIVSIEGCCQYTRAYQRPNGVAVRSVYRRAGP